jgi:hypothetical protein
MIGPLTIGKKAAKVGYRKFGVPGALALGLGAVGGYLVVRRKVKSMLHGETTSENPEESDGSQQEES